MLVFEVWRGVLLSWLDGGRNCGWILGSNDKRKATRA